MLTLLFSPKVHSLFHVNNTRVSAKASSELYSSRRRCHPREIVVIVHVAFAFASLGDLDEDRRRHRVSGLSVGVAKERDVVRSGRSHRSYQPEMSDHGCIHLNNFKAAKGIQPYKVIHSFFVTSTSTEARVRKVRQSFSFSLSIRGQGSLSRNLRERERERDLSSSLRLAFTFA